MLNFFKKKTEWKGNEIYSVVDGRLKKLEKVADPAFAQKMLGDGAAIDPQNELIVAPCEGTITMMYPELPTQMELRFLYISELILSD